MHGHSTSIFDPTQPNAEPKKFSFDYSYWSHDGFSENTDGYLAPESADYADQVTNSWAIMAQNNYIIANIWLFHNNFMIIMTMFEGKLFFL